MKEHHSINHVTEPCAGGNWKLSWIIQAVMSTKTPSGLSQQNNAGKHPTVMLQSETFSAILIPTFEIILPIQTRNEKISMKTPAWRFTRSQEFHLLLTDYWHLESRKWNPRHKNTFKHPVFHTVLKMPFNNWRVKCICVLIKLLHPYIKMKRLLSLFICFQRSEQVKITDQQQPLLGPIPRAGEESRWWPWL